MFSSTITDRTELCDDALPLGLGLTLPYFRDAIMQRSRDFGRIRQRGFHRHLGQELCLPWIRSFLKHTGKDYRPTFKRSTRQYRIDGTQICVVKIFRADLVLHLLEQTHIVAEHLQQRILGRDRCRARRAPGARGRLIRSVFARGLVRVHLSLEHLRGDT